MNASKAPGPDGIPSVVLRMCAAQLASPLLSLFRKTIEEGEIPQDWKNAKVVPIHKKGSKTKPGNYRPVSLTCHVCKVMEKIIKRKLITHLMDNDLLSKHQHGFTARKLCQSNLLEVLEKWTKSIDDGLGVDVIYLDYQKAFDSVPHRRLLSKLSGYGIQGRVAKWISAFLQGRRQQVVIRSGQSSWVDVTSGVPQGSVLGPVLVIVYVNELPNLVSSGIKMFADDTKIYRNIHDRQDVNTLQSDLSALEQWSNKWLLRFNPAKCKVMYCGPKNSKSEYYMVDEDGVMRKIEETCLEKDLGVYISNTLKPSLHCQKAANKGMSALRLIKMAFDRIDVTNFKILYTTYVRPHLEYCIQAVGPFTKKDIEILEKVQRRATKLVKGIRDLSYSERLQRLKLPSFRKRIIRGDLIETFKILTEKVKTDPEQFFELASQDRTRGHHLKLRKRRSRTIMRLKFFANRVVSQWNSLPEEIVEATSTNVFKNKLDLHWASSI